MSNVYVSEDMVIGDILRKYPKSAGILMACGMGCVGCPSAQMETLKEASYVHGIDSKDLVDVVNRELEKLMAE